MHSTLPSLPQTSVVSSHRWREAFGKVFRFSRDRRRHTGKSLPWKIGRAAVSCLALLFVVGAARAGATEVGTIGLTVGNLEREIAFFTTVLPFEKISESQATGEELERLHAIPGAQTLSARLRLGRETITLTEFVAPRGKPIPTDSRSFDRWFQHIAIVVRDMDAAYAHLLKHKISHVSTAPQTLPDWNPNAGGIKAFYFRDPEDHVLEIIWFPRGKGDARWQQPTEQLFLGIDHTAIVVSSTERSLTFYRDALGLEIAGGTENYGVEQEHLNQVFGARLRITALKAAHGPGIEFLEYITPPGGRPLPADPHTNDLLAWTTELKTERPTEAIRTAEMNGGTRASVLGPRAFVRDPDGHLMLITP